MLESHLMGDETRDLLYRESVTRDPMSQAERSPFHSQVSTPNDYTRLSESTRSRTHSNDDIVPKSPTFPALSKTHQKQQVSVDTTASDNSLQLSNKSSDKIYSPKRPRVATLDDDDDVLYMNGRSRKHKHRHSDISVPELDLDSDVIVKYGRSTDDTVNGHMNGHANGHVDGKMNGTTNDSTGPSIDDINVDSIIHASSSSSLMTDGGLKIRSDSIGLNAASLEMQIATLKTKLNAKDNEVASLKSELRNEQRNHRQEVRRIRNELHVEYSKQASQKIRDMYIEMEASAQKTVSEKSQAEIEDLKTLVETERKKMSDLVKACDEYLGIHGF